MQVEFVFTYSLGNRIVGGKHQISLNFISVPLFILKKSKENTPYAVYENPQSYGTPAKTM